MEERVRETRRRLLGEIVGKAKEIVEQLVA